MEVKDAYIQEQEKALKRFTEVMLPLMLGIGAILLLFELKRLRGDYISAPFLFHLSVFVGLLFLFLSRKRLEPRTNSLFIGFFLLADTAYSILSYGIEARSFLGIGYLCIFTSFIFGMRWGIVSFIFASALILLKGVLLKLGYVTVDDYLLTRLKTLEYWAILSFSFLFYPLPLMFLLTYTTDRLKERINELSEIDQILKCAKDEKEIAMETLKEKEKVFEALVNTPIAGFFILEDGMISSINKKACEILGIKADEAQGQNFLEFIHPDDRKLFDQPTLYEEDCTEKTLRVIRGDGIGYIALSFRGIQKGKKALISGVMIDVTKEKRLESELEYTRRTEIIANFIRGIAHDFNNILTAIEGYTSMLRARMKEETQIAYLDKITSSAERARRFIKDLLIFGRKEPLNPEPRKINELLYQAENLMRSIMTEDTEIQVFPCNEDLEVICDPAKMDRVFLNLASNARDAMGEKKVVALKAEPFIMGHDFIKTHGFGEMGLYALISISDSGCGMSEEIRKRIFEPFFTTKQKSKGTGLGLSIVYNIVKEHKGYITVESEPERGATFNIYLPAKSTYEISTEKGLTKTVLLAEDEDDLLFLFEEALRGENYSVISAKDGEEALNKFEESKERIDVVVLDEALPKRRGREVLKEMRRIKPDIRAIIMSGYEFEDKDSPLTVFLEKPIEIRTFIEEVNQIFDFSDEFSKQK